jgi:hypothetical protein
MPVSTTFFPYTVQRVVIDNVTWTALIPVRKAQQITIPNDFNEDIKFRTISADATTEKVIPAGARHTLADGYYPDGTTVCYIQSAASTLSVQVELVKWVGRKQPEPWVA